MQAFLRHLWTHVTSAQPQAPAADQPPQQPAPLLACVTAPVARVALIPPSSPPRAVDQDRANIADHPQLLADDATGWSYARPPVRDEWPAPLPDDAVVRVFVINAWTTVRVLHDGAGRRLGEPAIDSWHGAA